MDVRKILSTSFLVALIAFKISSMATHIHLHHNHEHEHGKEHCELCEQALEFISAEFSATGEVQWVEVFDNTISDLHKELYNSVCVIATTDSTLFGRPPPFKV